MFHINGGASDPSGLGFDVVDGNIVAIGENVRVWLSPGDTVPKCVGEHANPDAQIMYYDNGNVKAGNSGENYSDIFVINSDSGYMKGNNLEALKGVQGNKDTSSNGLKDYIFLTGKGEDYDLKAQGGQVEEGKTNNLSGITLYDAAGNVMLGSGINHLEGIIYGDGLSEYPGDTTVNWEIMLSLDITLDSTDNSQTLQKVILGNIPEGATFSNVDGVTVQYLNIDGNWVYVLTFEEGVSDYNGTLTVILPDGDKNIDDITLSVKTNEGTYNFEDIDFSIDSPDDFLGNIEYEYGNDPDASLLAGMTEDAGEETTVMASMEDLHITDSDIEDVQTEDHSLQPTLNDEFVDDNSHANDENTAAEHTVDSQDNHTENTDNPLVDNDQQGFDDADNETDHSAPDESSTADTNSETEESSLSTLLGSTEDGSLNETETTSEESHLNSESNESGQEATIISQDEPLSFSDMIDGDNKDLSSLIQTTETTETAETPNDVEHVPAEGGDTDDNQSWASNDPDDLIAKPEVEA